MKMAWSKAGRERRDLESIIKHARRDLRSYIRERAKHEVKALAAARMIAVCRATIQDFEKQLAQEVER